MREEKLIRYHVQWRVIEPVRLAVLDDAFARALTEWPQVTSALFERGMRRALRMSVQALLQLSPVETRLLVLFWFLAERWGHVTPAGIVVRLQLSHQLLGQLVGASGLGDHRPAAGGRQRGARAPSRGHVAAARAAARRARPAALAAAGRADRGRGERLRRSDQPALTGDRSGAASPPRATPAAA